LAEFETCDKRRGEAMSLFLNDLPTLRFLDPLDYYMGRALEGLGKTAMAKERYKMFLDIKAKADKGQVIVTHAHNRLENL
jgi:hypothetical protein